MASTVIGYVASYLPAWPDPTQWMSSLGSGAAHKVAGAPPSALYDILHLVQQINGENAGANIIALQERFEKIPRATIHSSIQSKLTDWQRRLDESSVQGIEERIATIKGFEQEIADTIIESESMVSLAIQRAGEQLHIAPECIREALKLINDKLDNKNYSTEQLVLFLQACSAIESLSSGELVYIRERITNIEQQRRFCWRGLKLFLEGLERKLNGAVANGMDLAVVKVHNVVTDTLQNISDGLFRHGDMAAIEILACRTAIRSDLTPQGLEKLQRDLNTLETTLANWHKDDSTYQEHLEELRELLQKSVVHVRLVDQPLIGEVEEEGEPEGAARGESDDEGSDDGSFVSARSRSRRPESPSGKSQRLHFQDRDLSVDLDPQRRDSPPPLLEKDQLPHIDKLLEGFQKYFKTPGIANQFANLASTWYMSARARGTRGQNGRWPNNAGLNPANGRRMFTIEEADDLRDGSPIPQQRNPATQVEATDLALIDECHAYLNEMKVRGLVEVLRLMQVPSANLIQDVDEPKKMFVQRLLAPLHGDGINLQRGLKRTVVRIYEALSNLFVHRITQQWLSEILKRAHKEVQADEINTYALEKLNRTLEQLSVDIAAVPNVGKRDDHLRHMREKRDTPLISSTIVEKLIEGARLEWAIESVLENKEIPLVGIPLKSLVNTLCIPANSILRKVLSLIIRLVFSSGFIKSRIEQKIDSLITPVKLQNFYDAALVSLTSDYREHATTDYDPSLGRRVDLNAATTLAKNAYKTALDVHEKCNKDHLDLISKLPAPLQGRVWDFIGHRIACAYENAFQEQTVEKIKLTARLHFRENPIDQRTGPDLLSLEDREQILSQLIANDIMNIDPNVSYREKLDLYKRKIASLPNPEDRALFRGHIQTLRTNLQNSQEKPSPDLTDDAATAFDNALSLIEQLIRYDSYDVEAAQVLLDRLKEGANTYAHKPIVLDGLLMEEKQRLALVQALNTALLTVRRIVTSKEIIKRIVLDQLYI